jgi:tRNA-2-methylthio-N6-dimethylallyladenosine synthase
MSVLVEKPGRNAGQMVGKSPYLNAVHLAASEETVGTIVPVRIVAARANSLAGERTA